MVAVAIYLLWDRMASAPPATQSMSNPSMTYTGGKGNASVDSGDNVLPPGLAPGRSPSQWLVRQAGDEAMDDRNPVDLPDYPGGTRTGGFRRRAAQQVEEVVFWKLPHTSARQALDYYLQAAEKAGFKPLGLAPSTQPDKVASTSPARDSAVTLGQLLAVTDPQSPRVGWVLVVRATQMPSGDTRVLLWLRYPIGKQP